MRNESSIASDRILCTWNIILTIIRFKWKPLNIYYFEHLQKFKTKHDQKWFFLRNMLFFGWYNFFLYFSVKLFTMSIRSDFELKTYLNCALDCLNFKMYVRRNGLNIVAGEYECIKTSVRFNWWLNNFSHESEFRKKKIINVTQSTTQHTKSFVLNYRLIRM